MRIRKTKKTVAVLGLLLLANLGIAPMANADTFTPQNDAPVVDITSNPTSMMPANPRSTQDYSVKATIGSQGTVANLKTVTMCWYLYDEASEDCINAATNPKHEFMMTWTEATKSFAVTGNNNYRDAGSKTNYGDGTGLSLEIEFIFKISNAMLHSGDWALRVVAIDDQDQSSIDSLDLNNDYDRYLLTVDYFGAVTTQRAAQDFGSLAFNGLQTISGIKTGDFIANGSSFLGIEATDFKYGSSGTVELSGTYPLPGEASLICSQGSLGGVYVNPTNSYLDFGLFSEGTGESAVTNLTHECTLKFGGGADVANVQYSNTVTITIGSDFDW